MRLRPLSLLLVVCSANAALAAQSSVSATPLGAGRGPLVRVAYISDESLNDRFELYSVPVDGSLPPLTLNDLLPPGGDVADVGGNPKLQLVGDRVLYVADQLLNDVFELFSVPVDGSAFPVRLNDPLVTGGDVAPFGSTDPATAFMAGKKRVVFIADGTVDERWELYSAPLDGSSPAVALTPALPVGEDVFHLVQFTSDESLVVFTTWAGVKEFLYVVPTDGSQPPLLLDSSGPVPPIGYSFFPEVAIAEGDEQVVYIAAADDDDLGILSNIFSRRLDGSTPPIRLNPEPRSVGGSFRIGPLGQRVLYIEEVAGSSDLMLQSVFLDGSGLVNLVPPGETADPRHYRLSPDAPPYVVFATYGGGGAKLYLASLDGSLRVPLVGPIASNIMGLELIPGGAEGVVYGRGTSSDTVQLFALHAPNQPLALTSPGAQGANLSTTAGFSPLGFTPDGKRLVFRGDLDTYEVDELYSVLVDGSQPAQRLNPPLPSGRTVWSFRLTPEGKRVLYMADQAINDRYELYSVPVDGSAAPVVLNSTPVTGGDVQTYTKAKAGSRLAPGP